MKESKKGPRGTDADRNTDSSYPNYTTLGDVAQQYARRGWAVFPLLPRSKKPMPDSNGFYDATCNLDVADEMWETRPDANIGLRTGAASGVFVLDVDPRHSGIEALRELEEEIGKLPETYTVKTGRGDGGLHFYFNHPGGAIPCRNVHRGPAIGCKGDGGYVVAAGSVHEMGGTYTVVNDVPVADAPEALLAKIRGEVKPTKPLPQFPSTNPTDITKALHHIPPDALDYDSWLHVGMALKKEGLPCSTWDSWSALDSARYKPGDCERKWQSFNGEGRTAATIVKMAQDYGFKPDRKSKTTATNSTPPPSIGDDSILTTDIANARRFLKLHGEDIAYTPGNGWLKWDGKRWRPDESGVRVLAHGIAKAVQGEAINHPDKDVADSLWKWARQTAMSNKLTAFMKEAAVIGQIDDDGFDANAFVVNVDNGTVELGKDGATLRPHRREDRNMKLIPYPYDPNAEAPLWGRFIDEILPDPGVREYVHKALGYTLTGSVREQIWFLVYGSGLNGKSTLINLALSVMSEYAEMASSSTFMLARQQQQGIRTDTASFPGKRFITAIETSDGLRLDEELLKSLSGGDKIRTRHLYKEGFSFSPVCKVWLTSNYKPRIKGTDLATWRRVRMIPFVTQIPPEKKDLDLQEKLQAESPGILTWLIEGAVKYLRDGLEVPEGIARATDEYRQDEDTIGRFLNDSTVAGSGYEAGKKEFYAAYKEWCEENGEHPVSQRRVSEYLKKHIDLDEYRSSGGRHMWIGVGLQA